MDTSQSLLESLRRGPEDSAWAEMHRLYTPLIRGWMMRHGAKAQDLDDIAQEVMIVVVRRFPEFQSQPHKGGFRGWLRSITAFCLRNSWKKSNKQPKPIGGSDFAEMVDALEDPHSGLSRRWDQEHDQYVTEYLLQSIQHEFRETTWRAFQLTALSGLSADAAAKQLQITPNAVLIAKSRVVARLRVRGRGLID